MSKFCPDIECKFWQQFPYGIPGKSCLHCSKELSSEKPLRNEEKKSDPTPIRSGLIPSQVRDSSQAKNNPFPPLTCDVFITKQIKRKLSETNTTNIKSDCPNEKKIKSSKTKSSCLNDANAQREPTLETKHSENSSSTSDCTIETQHSFNTSDKSRTVDSSEVSTRKRNIDEVDLTTEPESDTFKCIRKESEQSATSKAIIITEIDPNETEYVTIQFSTLILEEYWEKIDSICLKIGHKYFDDFKTSIVPFLKVKTVKLTNGNFVVITGTLKFPLNHVLKNVIKFPYQYFIYSNDGNESCEHLYHYGKNVNRYFIWNIDTYPQTQLDNGIYQQFDLMVLPEISKKGDSLLWGFAISAFNYLAPAGWKVKDIPLNKLNDRRLVSLQAFLPSYLGLGHSQPCNTLEDFILQFSTQLENLMRFHIYNPVSKSSSFVDQHFPTQKHLIESWLMATYTPKRITQLDPKGIIVHFYLACYLIHCYSLNNKELYWILINMVEESIESILENRSYLFDGSMCSEGKVRRDIHTSIVDFIFNKVVNSKTPEKLLTLVPIYHGICNTLHEELSYHDNGYWGFPNSIKLNWEVTISFDSIKRALSLVKFDKILPYTIIIYALNDKNVVFLCEHFFWATQHLPLSVLMSALLFRLEQSNNITRLSLPRYINLTIEVMKSISTALNICEDNLDGNDITSVIQLTLNLINKNLLLQQFNVEQFKLCLGLLSRCCKNSQSAIRSSQLNDKLGDFFKYFVTKWYPVHVFKNNNSYTDLLIEIEFWKEILANYTFPATLKWADIIKEFLISRFKDPRISQKSIIDLFILLHSNEKYSTLLQELFLKELTTRLQSISADDKNYMIKRLYDQLSTREQIDKVSSIFSIILLDENSTFNFDRLNHFLTWPAWETYFSILCSKSTQQILSVDAKKMLENACTQFSSLFKKINYLRLTGVEIQLIVQNRKHFFTLTNLVLKSRICEYSIQDIQSKFDLCLEMHNWFKEQYTALNHLNDFIQSLKSIDNETILTFLSLNFEKESMRDICYSNEESYLFVRWPEVNRIITFREFKSITTACISLKDSRIIIKEFDRFIYENGITMHTAFKIKSFYKEIWKPTLRICIDVLEKFITKTMLISEVCKYFDSTNNIDAITKDLTLFNCACTKYQLVARNDDSRCQKIMSCAKKISLYFKLQQCSIAAKLIIELKNELLLVSNFEIIEDMKNIKHTFENKQLKEVTDKVIKVALNLSNLSKSNLDVIQAIIDRIDFIMWIRNNLKDLNELKTFVDISLTTCGGNPVDVDRITCLSSVCTNFAPIIFQIDENTSYETLIARCRQVIESVERNKELTKLLRQVGENVIFWEEMKKSHGSVEETTLMQLDSIIKTGEFHLNVGESLNLCDIVSLSVDRENGEKRIYSLEQLREFRSKIMLVVGKSELPGLDTHTSNYENSQLFTHKLDTITEIATIVIQLAETGNQRYLNYELFSQCNQQEDTLMETKLKLRGTLEDWKINVEEARNRHYFLNYYTISQIVLLQKGTKSFIEDREDRELEQLYHLLGLLNPDVSKQDIQQALEQFDIILKPKSSLAVCSRSSVDFSKQSLSAAISTQYSYINPIKPAAVPFVRYSTTQTEFPDSLTLTEKEFAHRVSEAGLPLELAIRGIRDIKSKDEQILSETNLLTWCIDHEMDSDTELMDDEKVYNFNPRSLSTESHKKVAIDLDFYQLGSLLDSIHESAGIRAERELPYNLKSGTPNLILIPSVGMLEFVLSLYMSDNDKLPLPYYHEILICTPQTKLEEIDIFWRRSVMIPDRLNLFLFCLVGIENLSYDVAVQAVSRLKYLQQNDERIATYKLALICSEDKEESSYMAAALDDCKIPIFSTRTSLEVKEYLSCKLSNLQRLSKYMREDLHGW